MNRILKIGFMVLLSLCVGYVAQAQEAPWNLRLNKNDISVYTRKVEASAIREFKAETIVHAPLERAIALFENEKQTPHWYYQCIQMDLVESVSPTEKIFYFALNLPWPVAERDSVSHRVKTEDKSTGAITYELVALPERLPKKKGRIRVPYARTLWRFTPLKDGTTQVYFQQHGDAGGSIPAFLANALVVDIPYHSLKNFRQLVEQ